MHKQLPSGIPSLCLTDAPEIKGVNTAPLLFDFPGWWSKLELFNPEHPVLGNEDILYCDIDTVIFPAFEELFYAVDSNNIIMLQDFTNPAINASGMLYIPRACKERIWSKFIESPSVIIEQYDNIAPPHFGDQGFLSDNIDACLHWQKLFPNKIFSYKHDIACLPMIGATKPVSTKKYINPLVDNLAIVCFHGKPRPWELPYRWIPKFSTTNTLKGTIRHLYRSIKISLRIN